MISERNEEVFQAGIHQFNAKNYSNALALFRSLGSLNAFALWDMTALTLFNLEAYEDAISAIDRAIGCEPLNINGYLRKVDFFERLGQTEKAASSLNDALLISPQEPNLLFQSGNLYSRIGKPVLAEKQYQNYLTAIYPTQTSIKDLQSADLRYHIENQKLRNSHFLNYPTHVVFETYAKCNATCNFCVYPQMARKGEKMPMELIEKIISDLQQIPREVKFQLSPFGVNEPFLDKRLFTVLDLIRERLPNAQITLTSNASPINQLNLKKLSAYALEYLWLSVVDYRKDIYEEKMQLSYELTMSRLRLIHKAKEDGWFDKRVVLSRLMDHSEHDALYTQFMKTHFPLFEVCLWPYANWLGQTSNELTSSISNIPCSHWFEFRIDVNGMVQHCCMDGHTEYPWGDIRKNSVLEIYNQESYLKLRATTFSRLEVEPCNKCNLR